MKLIFKLIKFIGILLAIALALTCFFAMKGIYDARGISPEPITQNKINKNIKLPDYRRSMSSSYLTFPEWYIVYSSREYSNYLEHNLPSGFPYFASIEQYWQSYATVYRLSKNQPFNFDDNLMLVVIGISYSAEYALKGLYENTVGRLSEIISGHQMVDEDKYAHSVMQSYVNFIPYRPWFEFSFLQSLKGLWQQTPLLGTNIIRKWERKMILSLEYGIKSAYASIIGYGSHATLGVASDYVYATIRATSGKPVICPGGKVVEQLSQTEYVVGLPHEQPFTECVEFLAQQPVSFVDIAGNQQVLLSVLVSTDLNYNLGQEKRLFSMPILTDAHLRREVLLVQVNNLIDLIREFKRDHVAIEHIYDY